MLKKFFFFILIFIAFLNNIWSSPLPVTNLKAETGNSNGIIFLSWTYPGPETLPSESKYYIQHSTFFTVNWSTSSAQIVISTGPVPVYSSQSWTVTGLNYGTTYYFKIWSSSGTSGPVSPVSNSATAWAQVDVLAPDGITDLTAVWGPKNGEVILSWTAPGNDGKTGSVSFYTIKYSQDSYPVEYNDSFEDGNLNNWETGGDADWIVDLTCGYKSRFSAKSGKIGNNQFTYLKRNVTGPFKLTWRWKVSSEIYFDRLRFYIDNNPSGYEISGNVDWTKVEYNIPEGNHTIEWRYVKDESISIGEDAGWVDNISSAENWWETSYTWKQVRPSYGSAGYNETETLTGLLSSTTYYFSVVSFDNAGNVSDYSNLASTVTRPDTTAPSQVTDLVSFTGPGDREITLSWTSPGDNGKEGTLLNGSKIKIQYSTYSSVTWDFSSAQITISTQNINPGAILTSTLTGLSPGGTYYIRIWICDEVQNFSPASNITTTWAQVNIPPSAVNNLSAVPGIKEKEIILNWTSPGDDGNTGILKDGSTIKIEYSTGSTHNFSYLSAQVSISTSNINPGTNLSWTLTGLLPGVTYYIRLWTLDELSNCSSVSNSASTWAEIDNIPPAPVTDLTANRDNCFEKEINLMWSCPGDNDWTGEIISGKFRIQYSNTPVSWSTSTAQIEMPVNSVIPGTVLYHKVTGLNSGTTYYFRVWTCDEGDRWSPVSNGATTWAAFDTVPPGRITTLVTSPGSVEGTVRLTWIAPGDNNYTGTASGYEIRYSSYFASGDFAEDFEDGNMDGWETGGEWGGTLGWIVVSNEANFGRYSARSGAISHGQRSYIKRDVTGPFTLSWWWKVSSDSTDHLYFFLDSDEIYSISGDINWHRMSYSIPEGSHTIKWIYEKDGGGGSSGHDAGWIDDITSGLYDWWNSANIWKSNRPVSGPAGTLETEIITGLINNTTNYVCIRAFDEVNNFSVYSNISSTFTQVDITPPAGISDLTALVSNIEGEIKLQWTAPGDDEISGTVSGYILKCAENEMVTSASFQTARTCNIYWNSFLSGGQAESRVVSGLDYNTTFYFALKAYDDNNNFSVWNSSKDYAGINIACSAWVYAVPPSPITDLTAQTGPLGGSIVLQWTSTGDDGKTGDITGGVYVVKCSSMPDVSWDQMNYTFIISTNTSPGRKETRMIAGLENGVTYYIYIKTGDEGGLKNLSQISNKTTTWAQVDIIPPERVTDLVATAPSGTEGTIRLTWTDTGDDGLVGPRTSARYELRYSESSTDTWNTMPIKITWSESTYPGNLKTRDIAGLNPDTPYYFYLKTGDEMPNWSEESNKVSAVPIDLIPPAPTGLTALEGPQRINLSWNPVNVFDLHKTQPYLVYYSTSPEDSSFKTLAYSTCPSYTHGGLSGNVRYYYRVVSRDTPPVVRQSTWSETVSAVTYQNVPDIPPNFIGIGIATDTIRWQWSDVNFEHGYLLYTATGGLITSTIPANITYYEEKGLLPNTEYTRMICAYNYAGFSGTNTAKGYTNVNKPENLYSTGQTTSTISLAWTPGEGGAFCYAIQRATDGVNFTNLVSYANNWKNNYFTDGLDLFTPPLMEFTTYWYRVAGFSRATPPVLSPWSNIIAVRTSALFPEPVRDLTAKPLEGRRVQLSWKKPPGQNLGGYKIYYSSWTINYSSAQVILTSTVTTWTSSQLQANTLYKFVIRSLSQTQRAEENTNEVAVPVLDTLSSNKASISILKNGNKISGNRITLGAEAISGNINNISRVKFQFRQFNGPSWQDISEDNYYPFFAYFDTSGLSEGLYQLRAISTDNQSQTDTIPGYITVTVNRNNFDIEENSTGSGQTTKRQKIYNDIDNNILAGHPSRDTLTEIQLPSGALNVLITTITVITNPANKPQAQAGLLPANEWRQIQLENNQIYLENSINAILIMPFEDKNHDGYVDSTGAKVDDIGIYRYDTRTSLWERLSTSEPADKNLNTIKVTLNRFSYYGIFAPVEETLDNMKIYPNPFKPNSGHNEIRFTNLPVKTVKIRILNTAGELVYYNEVSQTGSFSWDGKNNSGNNLSSGIYIYSIECGDSKKKGIITIIR